MPVQYNIRKKQLDLIYYPALIDNQHTISIRLFDSLSLAKYVHKMGLTRMYLFYLTDVIKAFKRNISPVLKKNLTKQYASFGNYETLLEEILFSQAYHLFVANLPLIRTKSQFLAQLEKERKQFLLGANHTLTMVEQILNAYVTLLYAIEKYVEKSKEFSLALNDIKQQLSDLFQPHFLLKTPLVWLRRYSVYLKAITLRLEKLPRQIQQDKQAMTEIQVVQKAYSSKIKNIDLTARDIDDPVFNFHWKIEELRISYFAQGLKTIEPVSKIRLLKILENLR